MERMAEWDKQDGWDRIERAIDSFSKWALVLAGTALLIRFLIVGG